jgi:hypothetical protein
VIKVRLLQREIIQRTLRISASNPLLFRSVGNMHSFLLSIETSVPLLFFG